MSQNARWMRRVDIGQFWNNDDLTFEDRRDGIVAKLRRLYPWAERCDLAHPSEPTLRELLDDLAGAPDVEQFDEVWHDIYDWADTDKRLWIDLYGPLLILAAETADEAST